MNKAMILAAGRGLRLRPYTDTLPKALIPIAGKPLIVYHLEKLANQGFTDVVINHAYLGSQIETSLGDGSQFGLQIHYSPEPQPTFGTGGGIYAALPLLGDEPFAVISSDIFTGYAFDALPKQLNGLAHLVLVDNPCFKTQGDFVLRDGRITIPTTSAHTLTFAGIAIYHPKLFQSCQSSCFPISDILQKAIQQQLVSGEYYTGQWLNINDENQLNLAKHKNS